MKTIFLFILWSVSLWGYGEKTVYWVPGTCKAEKNMPSVHGGHAHKENTQFCIKNLEENGSAQLILPDLSDQTVPITHNALTLPKPKMGGYYALVLTQRSAQQTDTAIRYLSLNGRPVKISPTQLTALSKADFEIVPAPLHREHDRYTASKAYRFIVMFQGKPLPEKSVVLETLNGTTKTYISDTKGVVTVDLPDDFKNVTVGRSENKPSEFLLSTRHSDGNLTYQSTLSMPYSVNPNDYWQSQPLGAGAVLIGFLGGLFLYRRIKPKGALRG